jgi:flavin-dependent dehydrogenase
VAQGTLGAHGLAGRREGGHPHRGGFVGMVDRDTFDEWLRERAAEAGAERRTGTFERIERDADGTPSCTSAHAKGAQRRSRPAACARAA